MTVETGDRYIKAGVPAIVWIVSRISKESTPISHAILIQESHLGRQITLSVPALETTWMYTKLEQ